MLSWTLFVILISRVTPQRSEIRTISVVYWTGYQQLPTLLRLLADRISSTSYSTGSSRGQDIINFLLYWVFSWTEYQQLHTLLDLLMDRISATSYSTGVSRGQDILSFLLYWVFTWTGYQQLPTVYGPYVQLISYLGSRTRIRDITPGRKKSSKNLQATSKLCAPESVTRSTFLTQDPQISRATVQYLISRATWPPWFVLVST